MTHQRPGARAAPSSEARTVSSAAASVGVRAPAGSMLLTAGTVRVTTRRLVERLIKRHPRLMALNFVLTFGSPLLGSLIAGIPGVLLGLVLAYVSWVLSSASMTREIVVYEQDSR